VKQCALFAGMAILLAFGSLSASVISCPTSTTFDVLESFNSASNACFSQDKLFWGFNYVPGTGAPAASQVTSDLIFQTSPALDVHGWNFGANWIQTGASLANFVLSFTTEVCPLSESACAANVLPGESISGADATYAPVSVLPAGNETVSWSNGALVTLTDGSPGPLPSNGDIGLPPGFQGPITVMADFSGTGGVTQTSLRFFETVVATPEPSFLGFTVIAFVLIAITRLRKKEPS